MNRLFLGLDCSTQSLSALLIDYDQRKVVYEKQLIFEQVFPQYHTKSGTLRSHDSLVVHSPPLMWVEALDRLFQEMREEGVPLDQILAISGSAQQHGSVYLNDSFLSQPIDPNKPLIENLSSAFSRETAPIWMDASTAKECQEIRDALGGMLATVEATGSNTFERFTGPQIRKFYKTEREAYEKTSHIALISSFLASVMTGQISPIDYGDGSGMNLMDIRHKRWHEQALNATAPRLREKLPPLVPSTHFIGTVNPYFVKKYGLNNKALSQVWTGDNPSSMIGLGLIEEGMVAISLGTSFTHFGCIKEFHIDPKGEGHLFVSPTGDYMTLNCFLNGALAIQKMRESYGLDWNGFNKALESTPIGNRGGLLLPYFEAEIIPKILNPGLRRFHLSEKDAPANCRALVEAQMMSMRLHAGWMNIHPKEIHATGGVSHNKQILQIVADVHNCKVVRNAVSKSTALGAALRAAYGYFANHAHSSSWKEIVLGFTSPDPSFSVQPNPISSPIYNDFIKEYAAREKQVIQSQKPQ